MVESGAERDLNNSFVLVPAGCEDNKWSWVGTVLLFFRMTGNGGREKEDYALFQSVECSNM